MKLCSRWSKPILALGACLLFFEAPAMAAVPLTLTQQGRLYDKDGAAVTATHPVTFTIYDAPASAAPLWTETLDVTFEDGYYSAELGAATSLTEALDGPTRYLGIAVANDAEMTPRAEITSVPYAVFAGDVLGDIHPSSVFVNSTPVIDSAGKWVGDPAGLVGPVGPQGPQGPPGAGWDLLNGNLFNTTPGDVGIGLDNPSAKLHVAGDLRADGPLITAQAKVKRDFFTFTTTVPGSTPIHIKTNLPVHSDVMYRFLVEGYSYGTALPVNSEAVGYTYSSVACLTSAGVVNHVAGANAVTLSQYCSFDGFVVLKLDVPDTYCIGFSVSAWFTNPTGPFDVTATAIQQPGNL